MLALASTYNLFEKYKQAFDLCQQVKEKFQTETYSQDTGSCNLHSIMCTALLGLRKPKEAVEWAEKQVINRQRIYGGNHSSTLIAMDSLATIYAEMKLFRKAYALQEQCVSLMKRNLGNDHPTTLVSEARMLDLLCDWKGDFFPRRKVINKRKDIVERMRREFGETAWRTMDCKLTLAGDYVACSSFQKAKIIQESLVDIMSREFGEDDARTKRGREALAQTTMLITARKVVYWWVPRYLLR